MKTIQSLFLLLIGVIAAGRDLRFRRIPNRLLRAGLAGSLAGTVLRCAFCSGRTAVTPAGGPGGPAPLTGGPEGPALLVSALLGMTVPPLTLFILFHFHMIGAGDIKLLAVFGSFLGPVPVFRCILISFFIGGFISAFLLFRQKNLGQRFRYFFSYVKDYARTGKRKPYITDIFGEGTFSFSVSIVLAYIVCMASAPGAG